jgi:heme-degrading monooxygenase HmoA
VQPLPWTTGAAAASAPGETAVVLASRLDLRNFRDVPGFLRAALALRRHFREVPGGVGLALHAQPLHRRFFTLSAWTDEAAMQAFVEDPAHVAVMRRFRTAIATSAFTTWSARRDAVPSWPDAKERLAHEQGASTVDRTTRADR